VELAVCALSQIVAALPRLVAERGRVCADRYGRCAVERARETPGVCRQNPLRTPVTIRLRRNQPGRATLIQFNFSVRTGFRQRHGIAVSDRLALAAIVSIIVTLKFRNPLVC